MRSESYNIMNGREIRLSVTRLKDYLDEVGIKVTPLAELSGMTIQHLQKCLVGEVDQRNGAVRTMSDDNLAHLQEALHQLSLKLKYTFIYYNTDMEIEKRNGCRYCPDCVGQIKQQLSPYFSILAFMQYALGWNRNKVRNIMDMKTGTVYGNISRDDVNRINIKLAEIATRLDVFTLTKE